MASYFLYKPPPLIREASSVSWKLYEGDCRLLLPTLPDASVDCVVTDPPYPEIDRDYGRWTEAAWFDLMDAVVPECRRVLKPRGSAVFILQPNSQRVGRMRTWLWRFLLQWGEQWGVVQDAYWWNTSALPLAGACKAGLMRPSLKYAVWLGPPDCYRSQDSVLLLESQANEADRLAGREFAANPQSRRRSDTEGLRDVKARLTRAATERGGVTPFNVFPAGNDGAAAVAGHGAGTPLALMRWWVRYLTPPGGVVLDPFAGSGTLGLACACEGRDSVMIERCPAYCETIRRRMAEAGGPLFASRADAAPGPAQASTAHEDNR